MIALIAEGIPTPNPTVEIVPMTIEHAQEMARVMRDNDMHEALALGVAPLKLLIRSFKHSTKPKAALIDGKLAAVWGVSGCFLGNTGIPWLVTSNVVGKVSPLKFARIYQQQVKEFLEEYAVLVNWVDSTYNEAIRLLKIVGFTVEPALPIGYAGAPFNRFYMQRTI